MPKIKKNISANIETNQKGGNPQVLIAVGIFRSYFPNSQPVSCRLAS